MSSDRNRRASPAGQLSVGFRRALETAGACRRISVNGLVVGRRPAPADYRCEERARNANHQPGTQCRADGLQRLFADAGRGIVRSVLGAPFGEPVAASCRVRSFLGRFRGFAASTRASGDASSKARATASVMAASLATSRRSLPLMFPGGAA